MHDDEPPQDADVRRALDAWSALDPPTDFAGRVLAARDEVPAPRRRRVRRYAGIALAGAAAAAAVVAALTLRSPDRAARGTLIATQRTSAKLGDRGVAVAEPTTELTWRISDDGAAEVTQRTGNVFYRVERGGSFVVHTPAGDIRVTGTCFRIEVPMTAPKKLLLAGLTGAALASTVLVTVYEGHVIAQTRSTRTELAAGTHATLRDDDASITIGAPPAVPTVASLATPTDDLQATREQLLERTRVQQAELNQLRMRIAQLEHTGAAPRGRDVAAGEPGRPWHDPSHETLLAWAAECHVRADDPSLDQFTPLRGPDTSRGMDASDVDAYNEAMSEVAKQWKELVRSLYLETTNDAAGADTLSVDAMRREIEDKTPREERPVILQKLSRERAGLAAPPADLGKTSTLERLLRAFVGLGDRSEAALAKRIGAERARAIRGDGWGSRSDSSECPPPSAR